jgi:methionyl-tRNA formyltransferase
MKTNYVFFGTPRFAAVVLGGLIAADMPPTAVVCNPDRPVGRKHIVTPPPTKTVALETSRNIDILQPDALDDAFIRRLAELEPDFFIVAAYARIIPARVLGIPRLGTLGIHPSLLPAYRGASPIQSVILAGETKTGSTIYVMDEKMDHGPILAQQELALDPIATDYETLEWELAALSATMLAETIPAFVGGTARAVPQDESRATFTKKFSTDNGFIKDVEIEEALDGASDKAELIVRTVNALNPEPGAWTIRNGKRIKLLAARMERGALRLVRIQREGERPVAVTGDRDPKGLF